MNFGHTSTCQGKVLSATIVLIFLFTIVIVLGYGILVNAAAKWNREESWPAVLNAPNTADEETTGLVKGIVFNPPDSSAVVEDRIVHPGDKIRDVLVVTIQKDRVEFAKDGLTWQQKVREEPHPAWN